MKIRYDMTICAGALAILGALTLFWPDVPSAVRLTLAAIGVAACGAFFTIEWRRGRRSRTAGELFYDQHCEVLDALEQRNSEARRARYFHAWIDQCTRLLAAGVSEEDTMKRMAKWSCENMDKYLATPATLRA